MKKTIKKGSLTFTANWLNDEQSSLSVVVSSSLGELEFEELTNLSWPSDSEISKLVGRKVVAFDGGDSIAETIYLTKEVRS